MVSEAGDGQDAFDMAESRNFHLIITDLNMPRMDGITLIRKLRGHSRYKFVPILMLTTETSADLKMKGKEAGATGWLVKPFEPKKLIGVVQKVLG